MKISVIGAAGYVGSNAAIILALYGLMLTRGRLTRRVGEEEV